MVNNRHLISSLPFQQPPKQVQAAHIWRTISTTTLWTLWKTSCRRLYDLATIVLLDVLSEIWDNLLAIVRGQYDTMHGSSKNINKRRKKLLQAMENVAAIHPIFSMVALELSTSLDLIRLLCQCTYNIVSLQPNVHCSLRAFLLILQKKIFSEKRCKTKLERLYSDWRSWKILQIGNY